MRKKMIRILCIASAAVTLLASGCANSGNQNSIGKFGKVTNGIYLYKDMAVQDSYVEEFDTKKYDLNEYRGFLDEEIAAYNKSNAFHPGDEEVRGEHEPAYTAPITVVKCETGSGNINQQLLYATAEDFLKYNEEELESRGGSTLQTGTLQKVDTKLLTASFVGPDGKDLDVQALCVSKNAAEYRYVICDFAALLYGDGALIGYTKNGSYSAENSCVTVKGGEKVIVIFK